MSNRIEIGHGLALNFTSKEGETVPSDVWVQFWGEDGKSAAISIAAEAERTGRIIGAGLRSWASDRINEYMAAKIAEEDAQRERDDNGQFGVGA
jgi:hypothetical protein